MTNKTETCECGEDKSMNQYQKALHAHFVAQWITSLAISVVCCAVLFVVFAGYIVKIHEQANIAEVRVEVLTERVSKLQSEVMLLQRGPLVQINSPTAPQITQGATSEQPPANADKPADAAKATDENGISLPPGEAGEQAKEQEPAVPVPAKVAPEHAKPATH